MSISVPLGAPVQLGTPRKRNSTAADRLHQAILLDKPKIVKKLLQSGCSVSVSNNLGQTPVFCSAYTGHTQIVEILLRHGADPNQRCRGDYTAVHGACYQGNKVCLELLLEAGGDLRLHDSKNQTPRDWALLQPHPGRRRGILQQIETARLCAMRNSGKDALTEKINNFKANSYRESLTQFLRRRLPSRVVTNGHDDVDMGDLVRNVHSMGFGKAYYGNGEKAAAMASIPAVAETSLVPDKHFPSYRCGAFTQMVPKLWQQTRVTVRQLLEPSPEGAVVDILISELEMLCKIQHPQVLLLMGVCQTDNLESLVLVFEHVQLGSLYHCLHEKNVVPGLKYTVDILLQVCDALIFFHSHKWLHCAVTSHAIHMASPHVVKLACLEYAVEDSEQKNKKGHHLLGNRHWHALYNWLAPEVLIGESPCQLSDLYSFCCVMWELCTYTVPWATLTAEEVVTKVVAHQQVLPLDAASMPTHLYHLMGQGLKLDLSDRDLDLTEVRDMLVLARRDTIKKEKMDLKSSKRIGVVKKPLKDHGAPLSGAGEGAEKCETEVEVESQLHNRKAGTSHRERQTSVACDPDRCGMKRSVSAGIPSGWNGFGSCAREKTATSGDLTASGDDSEVDSYTGLRRTGSVLKRKTGGGDLVGSSSYQNGFRSPSFTNGCCSSAVPVSTAGYRNTSVITPGYEVNASVITPGYGTSTGKKRTDCDLSFVTNQRKREFLLSGSATYTTSEAISGISQLSPSSVSKTNHHRHYRPVNRSLTSLYNEVVDCLLPPESSNRQAAASQPPSRPSSHCSSQQSLSTPLRSPGTWSSQSLSATLRSPGAGSNHSIPRDETDPAVLNGWTKCQYRPHRRSRSAPRSRTSSRRDNSGGRSSDLESAIKPASHRIERHTSSCSLSSCVSPSHSLNNLASIATPSRRDSRLSTGSGISVSADPTYDIKPASHTTSRQTFGNKYHRRSLSGNQSRDASCSPASPSCSCSACMQDHPDQAHPSLLPPSRRPSTQLQQNCRGKYQRIPSEIRIAVAQPQKYCSQPGEFERVSWNVQDDAYTSKDDINASRGEHDVNNIQNQNGEIHFQPSSSQRKDRNDYLRNLSSLSSTLLDRPQDLVLDQAKSETSNYIQTRPLDLCHVERPSVQPLKSFEDKPLNHSQSRCVEKPPIQPDTIIPLKPPRTFCYSGPCEEERHTESQPSSSMAKSSEKPDSPPREEWSVGGREGSVWSRVQSLECQFQLRPPSFKKQPYCASQNSCGQSPTRKVQSETLSYPSCTRQGQSQIPLHCLLNKQEQHVGTGGGAPVLGCRIPKLCASYAGMSAYTVVGSRNEPPHPPAILFDVQPQQSAAVLCRGDHGSSGYPGKQFSKIGKQQQPDNTAGHETLLKPPVTHQAQGVIVLKPTSCPESDAIYDHSKALLSLQQTLQKRNTQSKTRMGPFYCESGEAPVYKGPLQKLAGKQTHYPGEADGTRYDGTSKRFGATAVPQSGNVVEIQPSWMGNTSTLSVELPPKPLIGKLLEQAPQTSTPTEPDRSRSVESVDGDVATAYNTAMNEILNGIDLEGSNWSPGDLSQQTEAAFVTATGEGLSAMTADLIRNEPLSLDVQDLLQRPPLIRGQSSQGSQDSVVTVICNLPDNGGDSLPSFRPLSRRGSYPSERCSDKLATTPEGDCEFLPGQEDANIGNPPTGTNGEVKKDAVTDTNCATASTPLVSSASDVNVTSFQQGAQRSNEAVKECSVLTEDLYFDDEFTSNLSQDPNMQLQIVASQEMLDTLPGDVDYPNKPLFDTERDRGSPLSMEVPSTGPQSLRSEYSETGEEDVEEEEEDDSPQDEHYPYSLGTGSIYLLQTSSTDVGQQCPADTRRSNCGSCPALRLENNAREGPEMVNEKWEAEEMERTVSDMQKLPPVAVQDSQLRISCTYEETGPGPKEVHCELDADSWRPEVIVDGT